VVAPLQVHVQVQEVSSAKKYAAAMQQLTIFCIFLIRFSLLTEDALPTRAANTFYYTFVKVIKWKIAYENIQITKVVKGTVSLDRG
jgi:hypothetical protein